MKKLSLILLLILCSIKLFAQKTDCAKFKTGTFKATFSNYPVIIKRTQITEKEYVNGATIPAIFNIKWIDSCTYTLSLSEEMLKKVPTLPKQTVETIRIIKILGNTCTISITNNSNNNVVTLKTTKISDSY